LDADQLASKMAIHFFHRYNVASLFLSLTKGWHRRNLDPSFKKNSTENVDLRGYSNAWRRLDSECIVMDVSELHSNQITKVQLTKSKDIYSNKSKIKAAKEKLEVDTRFALWWTFFEMYRGAAVVDFCHQLLLRKNQLNLPCTIYYRVSVCTQDRIRQIPFIYDEETNIREQSAGIPRMTAIGSGRLNTTNALFGLPLSSVFNAVIGVSAYHWTFQLLRDLDVTTSSDNDRRYYFDSIEDNALDVIPLSELLQASMGVLDSHIQALVNSELYLTLSKDVDYKITSGLLDKRSKSDWVNYFGTTGESVGITLQATLLDLLSKKYGNATDVIQDLGTLNMFSLLEHQEDEWVQFLLDMLVVGNTFSMSPVLYKDFIPEPNLRMQALCVSIFRVFSIHMVLKMLQQIKLFLSYMLDLYNMSQPSQKPTLLLHEWLKVLTDGVSHHKDRDRIDSHSAITMGLTKLMQRYGSFEDWLSPSLLAAFFLDLSYKRPEIVSCGSRTIDVHGLPFLFYNCPPWVTCSSRSNIRNRAFVSKVIRDKMTEMTDIALSFFKDESYNKDQLLQMLVTYGLITNHLPTQQQDNFSFAKRVITTKTFTYNSCSRMRGLGKRYDVESTEGGMVLLDWITSKFMDNIVDSLRLINDETTRSALHLKIGEEWERRLQLWVSVNRRN
jgi:hypothetical protein